MSDLGTLMLIVFLGAIAYGLVLAVLHTLGAYCRTQIEAYDEVRKAKELRRAYLQSVAQRGQAVDQRA